MTSNKKCSAKQCSKNGLIYFNDKYERINDHVYYHQNCFRCTNCSSKLNIQFYAQTKNNILLCKKCSEAINTSKRCSNCDKPLLDTEKFIISEGGVCYHSHCFENASETSPNYPVNICTMPQCSKEINNFLNDDAQNKFSVDTNPLEYDSTRPTFIGFEALALDVISSSNNSTEVKSTKNDELHSQKVAEVKSVVSGIVEPVKMSKVDGIIEDDEEKNKPVTSKANNTNSIVKIDIKNLGSSAANNIPDTPYSPSSLERDDRCGSLRIIRRKEYDTRSVLSNKSFLNSSRISLNAFKSKVSNIFTTKKRIQRPIENNFGSYEILIRYEESQGKRNFGRLCVQIKSAILKDTEKKNAYAGIQLLGRDRYTKSIYDNPRPEFDEQFDYITRKPVVINETLILTDYRSKWGKIIRTSFGTIKIPLANIDEINGRSIWYNIQCN